MLVSAAFCPEPPLLHPQVLGAAEQDKAGLFRSACSDALGRVLAAEPEAIMVIGGDHAPYGAASERLAATAYGDSDAREYGVAFDDTVTAALAAGDGRALLEAETAGASTERQRGRSGPAAARRARGQAIERTDR